MRETSWPPVRPPLLRDRARCASAWAFAVAAMLGAVGCSAASTPEVTNGDPTLELGRDLYIRQCASCHGGSGGGGRGPKLSDGAVTAAFPSIEDQITVVAEGRNAMPAYGGRMTDEELEAVVRFTREVLAVSPES